MSEQFSFLTISIFYEIYPLHDNKNMYVYVSIGAKSGSDVRTDRENIEISTIMRPNK